MKLEDIKKEVAKYQYFEDTDIIDVSLASMIATRLQLGDPIWLIIIGPSSGGKSQILRPLALTDAKFIHRVDDLTENTFLSASNVKGGTVSLLTRIGSLGMIVISDLTVIFSKAQESRATILSQFRMIYDGEMTKMAGNQAKPLHWKGYLGVLAGSTPSIYSSFEEVADMGERFIYYRMKPYDALKAATVSIRRKVFGKKLDDTLSELYGNYVQSAVKKHVDSGEEVTLPDEVEQRILAIALFAEKVRTVAHMDWRNEIINKIPVSAMPMRVALQLIALAKGLYVMRRHEGKELEERDMHMLDWCGYSLANEEKRACLSILARTDYESYVSTQIIADKIGLDTQVVRSVLQNMSATGVLVRGADGGTLSWKIASRNDWELVRRIEDIKDTEKYDDRLITQEEETSMNVSLEEMGFLDDPS